jgi:hypothetical protein
MIYYMGTSCRAHFPSNFERSRICREIQFNSPGNFGLGGFSNWRLPEISELEGIYDTSVPHRNANKGGIQVNLISLTWSATQAEPGQAWSFTFLGGKRLSGPVDHYTNLRVPCVRRSEK